MTTAKTNSDLCREALEKALELCDGSQSELARRVGGKVKQPHVWKWIRAGRVPVERVPAVSRATGGQVLPHQLRPDLPDVFPVPSPAAERPRKKAA